MATTPVKPETIAKQLAEARLQAAEHDKPLLEEALGIIESEEFKKGLARLREITSQIVSPDIAGVGAIPAFYSQMNNAADNLRAAVRQVEGNQERAKSDLNRLTA